MFFFFFNGRHIKQDKHCSECGNLIPHNEYSYHAYIRTKYCKDCKSKVKREQTRRRVIKYREKKNQSKSNE